MESAVVQGDSAAVLAGLPTGVFQTCVTSPPYWSLRDYGIKGQIGLENLSRITSRASSGCSTRYGGRSGMMAHSG